MRPNARSAFRVQSFSGKIQSSKVFGVEKMWIFPPYAMKYIPCVLCSVFLEARWLMSTSRQVSAPLQLPWSQQNKLHQEVTQPNSWWCNNSLLKVWRLILHLFLRNARLSKFPILSWSCNGFIRQTTIHFYIDPFSNALIKVWLSGNWDYLLWKPIDNWQKFVHCTMIYIQNIDYICRQVSFCSYRARYSKHEDLTDSVSKQIQGRNEPKIGYQFRVVPRLATSTTSCTRKVFQVVRVRVRLWDLALCC